MKPRAPGLVAVVTTQKALAKRIQKLQSLAKGLQNTMVKTFLLGAVFAAASVHSV